MAHCSQCHITASNVDNFDRHIGERGKCRSPKSVGLIQNDRGTWLMPGERDISQIHRSKEQK
jgi:hypothetical protein